MYELDQLRKQLGVPAAERLTALNQRSDLVSLRDDLTVEAITLLNQTGKSQKALDMLSSRRFNPWEGGEGLVSSQYVRAHLLIGRSELENGQAQAALDHFAAAHEYPQNLGEGKHLLTPETHLDYFTGLVLSQLGHEKQAREYWSKAAEDAPITWMSYYRALCFQALGCSTEAKRILDSMHVFAKQQMRAEVRIDYFATSLPNFLLFEDDLQKRNETECLFIMAFAELGEGKVNSGNALLQQVLALDPSHLPALAHLQSFGESSQQRDANFAPAFGQTERRNDWHG